MGGVPPIKSRPSMSATYQLLAMDTVYKPNLNLFYNSTCYSLNVPHSVEFHCGGPVLIMYYTNFAIGYHFIYFIHSSMYMTKDTKSLVDTLQTVSNCSKPLFPYTSV